MLLPTLQQETEYVDLRPDHCDPACFYEKWVDQSSAKHATPELIAANALRSFYPEYSLVVSEDHRLSSLLALPDITIHSLDSKEADSQQLLNVVFRPAPRGIGGKAAGSLANDILFGTFKLTWSGSDFIVYVTKFLNGHFLKAIYFILHEGPEQRARDLVLATCLYAEQVHDEIWVFNRGHWSKDKALWNDIKDCSWDDVVMKEESKEALQKDIYGFFRSETTYKKLSIPWKRGLILYGPPGNGKTISIKAIINTCSERGFTPLYVKSFQGPQGEEPAMQSVFSQARQTAPCVLILEDLDSLINDRNRSFFLNQMDGLEGNDGLLVIASTNHFDKLDPGLASRPSRFDRRYLFEDPDYQARVLYTKYWQEKLKDNDELSFPDSLVQEVADLTEGFSFAYLKETFISALVRITNADSSEPELFLVVLKDQIMTLRKELGKQTLAAEHASHESRELREPPLLATVPSTQSDIDPGLPEFPSGSRLRPFLRGTSAFRHPQVLHAPPSAYPQVMPGSLPATSSDTLKASLSPSAAWQCARGTSTSLNDVSATQSRSPLSTDFPRPIIRLGKVDSEVQRSLNNPEP